MKGILIQFGCTFILALISSMSSFSAVWPSYALDILKRDQSPLGFKITQNEGNLISSIPMLGSVIATLIAGYVIEWLGRKKSLILCGLLYTVAWSLILTSRTTIQIVIGRFIIGLSSGTAIVNVLVYISEITQLSIRGSAVATANLVYNFGMLTSYLQGWFFSYELICYSSLTATVVYVIMMSCFKETPSYLLKTGREKEALNSLKFYRGESETTEAILEEFSYMKRQNNHGQDHREDKDSADIEKPQSEKEKLQSENLNIQENTANKNPWILLFTVPHNRRALINSVTFMVLTVSMGMVAVLTYASQFFTKAAPSMSPNLCSVLLAIILVLSNVLTMVVTDLVPRRALMISTCGAVTICLATLGAVMRWPGAPAWVALLAILVYCVAFHLGCINIVFVQLSESYGPQVNSVATSTILVFMFAANFLVLLLFVPAVDYLGIDGTFFVFAIIGAITTILAFFWIKETRRVPLEAIQKMYANGFMYKRISVTED